MGDRYFEIGLVMGFEETNLVGNVYFANHVRWQGKCREMFLRDYAPSVLDDLRSNLALITVRVSCDYFSELFPFDEVLIRMRAGEVVQNRITMLFEYLRKSDSGEEIIARGEQVVACMTRTKNGIAPTKIPDALKTALIQFTN